MISHQTSFDQKRRTIFHSRIEKLLDEKVEHKIFRISSKILGVTDGDIARRILSARKKYEFELTAFRPVQHQKVPSSVAASVMKALADDVKRVISKPTGCDTDMIGIWPHAGFRYLASLIYAGDSKRLGMLTQSPFRATGRFLLTACPMHSLRRLANLSAGYRPFEASSSLALLVKSVPENERAHLISLYSRVSSSLLTTVSSLITSAIWLSLPLNNECSDRNILLETLRLLPPAWNIFRSATPEFHQIIECAGETDDILIFPLLMHRNPSVWRDATIFAPSRWENISDPFSINNYLPFGYSNSFCWAKNLIWDLSEFMMKEIRRNGLAPCASQCEAHVSFSQVLTLSRVKVVQQQRVTIR